MKKNEQGFRYLMITLAIAVFLGIYFFPLGLPTQAQAVLAITALAMVLWISEAIPLHATALLVAFLLVTTANFAPEKVFAQFFDRVVVLVLGGFVLAVALSKHKLDEFLAQKVLGKMGTKPSQVLLGMITVTAFLSMWMANSAAAAIAMPIALVVLAENQLHAGKTTFGKALILAVAYGATIGGIGTIIGSTPNVLAQKFLTEQGVSFGFMEWFVRGFPVMLVLIVAAWLVLRFLFKPEIKTIQIKKHTHPFSVEQKKVALIFLLTVGLWVTESIHGIHNSIVALVPVILLYVFGLVDTNDFHKTGWDSLILIGGGIALGMAIENAGLSAMLSEFLGTLLTSQPYIIILFLMGIVGILLTSFLSNTAASAVLIPIITALSGVLGFDQTNLVVAAAIGVSMDFLFPMGTPPSALACSTGYVHTKDLFKAGIALSLIGAVLLAILSFFSWNFL